MDDSSKGNATVLLKAGAALAEQVRKTAAGREFIVIPNGYRLEDFDSLLPNPRRARAAVEVSEVESFIRYLKTFAADGNARIFASINLVQASIVLTAILDYHAGGKDGVPGWGDHRVTFRAVTTPEWQTWVNANKKSVAQAEFARFIEDNLDAIVTPPGARMLEIAKSLQADTSVAFKSAIRLENGDTQFKYTTETTGRAGGNGEMEIPGEFVLGLAPFQGGPAYKVRARLRYRIEEGHLRLWYELVLPHKVIEDAAREILATITADTEFQPFMGAAPASLR